MTANHSKTINELIKFFADTFHMNIKCESIEITSCARIYHFAVLDTQYSTGWIKTLLENTELKPVKTQNKTFNVFYNHGILIVGNDDEKLEMRSEDIIEIKYIQRTNCDIISNAITKEYNMKDYLKKLAEHEKFTYQSENWRQYDAARYPNIWVGTSGTIISSKEKPEPCAKTYGKALPTMLNESCVLTVVGGELKGAEVHRIVAETFWQDCLLDQKYEAEYLQDKSKWVVHHKDNNANNNSILNLVWLRKTDHTPDSEIHTAEPIVRSKTKN